MLTSPELISVTAETSHPQPRKNAEYGGRAGWEGVGVGGGANDRGGRREDKEGGERAGRKRGGDGDGR